MRVIKEHEKMHEIFSDPVIRCGGIPLPDKPRTDTLKTFFQPHLHIHIVKMISVQL